MKTCFENELLKGFFLLFSRKKYTFLLLAMISTFFYVLLQVDNENSLDFKRTTKGINAKDKVIKNSAYLLNTTNCKIPELDPYSEDVISFIHKEKPFKCSEHGVLTYIEKDDSEVTLKVNKSLVRMYKYSKLTCCYLNVTRLTDYEYRYSTCSSFQDTVQIGHPLVKVKCYNHRKEVYSNVHATVIPSAEKIPITSPNPKFSVLLLGLDSMSKSNLQRNMPKTYRYAEQHMYNLYGYNKVEDNTFPNILSILTGWSYEQYAEKIPVDFNNFDFIWDSFKDSGYKTAFAEDWTEFNMFHAAGRTGFLKEPTDYYYFAYFRAAESLYSSNEYCTGPIATGERIFNAAKDFAVTFKDRPNFGLFWTSTFSHDNINLPTVVDDLTLSMLTDPSFVSALKNSIFVFFSDHGFRFGNFRDTNTGWLEDRLPFIYIQFPEQFKQLFPEKFNNFLSNTRRLTVPYDLFNTFQEVLAIGDDTYQRKPSRGCPKCQSLFSVIPEERNCEDASIGAHYCTCRGLYSSLDKNVPMVGMAVHFAVDQINTLVESFREGHLCSMYSLRKILSAVATEAYLNSKNQTVSLYVVRIVTNPIASFEVSMELMMNDGDRGIHFSLGGISRTDFYRPVTGCVDDGLLKKYCYCYNFWTHLKKLFDFYKPNFLN